MEKKTCCKCKQNKVKKRNKYITFTSRGMQIKVLRISELCDWCIKDEWLKNLKQDAQPDAQQFIRIINGKPWVNWEYYHKYFAMGDFYHLKERLHHLLINLDILSYQAKGNWEIVADGSTGLNPRDQVFYLYFTQKEDALEFAHLEKTEDYWEIHHIDKVILR